MSMCAGQPILRACEQVPGADHLSDSAPRALWEAGSSGHNSSQCFYRLPSGQSRPGLQSHQGQFFTPSYFTYLVSN